MYSALVVCAPNPCNPNPSTTGALVFRPAYAASVPPPPGVVGDDQLLADLRIDLLRVRGERA